MAETLSVYDKYDGLHREAKTRNIYVSHDRVKGEQRARRKQISNILKKTECQRSPEEVLMLKNQPDVVQTVQKRAQVLVKKKQRILEVEDDVDVLSAKCQQLANAIKTSKKVVVYTGAGISTAASIPDYRGPNGIWTMLKQGRELEAQDLSDAEPTFTHMSITKLYTEGHVNYVVSQNCDGLHVRSSLPRNIISEVHGNMYLEVCPNCKPQMEYIRLFDVTEKTGVRRHMTGRKCHRCNSGLKDTVVHFGEKGGLRSPYWWKRAVKAANNADLILCLGTSLKVLKKYACLWCMDKRVNQRPKLFIVNLQWTPKDDSSTLKINGRCDDVMMRVMNYLNLEVEAYQRILDPIFHLSVPLRRNELKTTSNKILKVPKGYAPNLRVNRRLADKYKDGIELDTQPSAIKMLLNSPSTQKKQCETGENIKVLTEIISTPGLPSFTTDVLNNAIHISNRPPGSKIFPLGSSTFPPAFLVMKPVHDARLVGNFQLQVNIPQISCTTVSPDNLCDSKDSVCDTDLTNVTGKCSGTGTGLELITNDKQKNKNVNQDQALDLSKSGCTEIVKIVSVVSGTPTNVITSVVSDAPSSVVSTTSAIVVLGTLENVVSITPTSIVSGTQVNVVSGTSTSVVSGMLENVVSGTSTSKDSIKLLNSSLPRFDLITSDAKTTKCSVSLDKLNYAADFQTVTAVDSNTHPNKGISIAQVNPVGCGPSSFNMHKQTGISGNGSEAVLDKPCTLQTKRRSSGSVPGWFGKGLTIKKKRKF